MKIQKILVRILTFALVASHALTLNAALACGWTSSAVYPGSFVNEITAENNVTTDYDGSFFYLITDNNSCPSATIVGILDSGSPTGWDAPSDGTTLIPESVSAEGSGNYLLNVNCADSPHNTITTTPSPQTLIQGNWYFRCNSSKDGIFSWQTLMGTNEPSFPISVYFVGEEAIFPPCQGQGSWVAPYATWNGVQWSGPFPGLGPGNAVWIGPPPLAPCTLGAFSKFHQGDGPTNVPTSFGLPSTSCKGMKDRSGNSISDNEGRALTVNGGCALCSLSTMLSAFPGFEDTTPSRLNNYLTNTVGGYTLNPVKGYISGILVTNSRAAHVNWSAVCEFTGNSFYIEPNNTPVNNSTVSNYLSEYFCGYGDGVILRMEEYIKNNSGSYTDNGTHFIVVTGRTNSDWSVFDPGWQFVSDYPGRLTSLSGHMSGFTPTGKSPRYFNVIGGMAFHDVNSPINSCAIVADCPVEMLVTDPHGQQLGWNLLMQTIYSRFQTAAT